jgi:predicted nuclease of predicted toxin-antitoxin system
MGGRASVARIAHWITENYPVTALPLREIGLRNAEDDEIFAAARTAPANVLTKDSDFVRLLEQHGSPPKIYGSHAATHPTLRYGRFSNDSFQQP